MSKKCFKDEQTVITGTHAYNLPGYKPNDIDVCVLCKNSGEHYSSLYDQINSFARGRGLEVKPKGEYALSFSWGGTTFSRMSFGDYDLFLVDAPTFCAVETATVWMREQPLETKKRMALSKDFRVQLFQIFAAEIFNAS